MESSLVIGRDMVGSSVVVLRPVGDLDMLTSPALRSVLGSHCDRGHHVIVDLAEVTFVGSSALQAFVEAHGRARAHDSVLQIATAGRRQLLRPFAITGLDQVLNISEGSAEALVSGTIEGGLS